MMFFPIGGKLWERKRTVRRGRRESGKNGGDLPGTRPDKEDSLHAYASGKVWKVQRAKKKDRKGKAMQKNTANRKGGGAEAGQNDAFLFPLAREDGVGKREKKEKGGWKKARGRRKIYKSSPNSRMTKGEEHCLRFVGDNGKRAARFIQEKDAPGKHERSFPDRRKGNKLSRWRVT